MYNTRSDLETLLSSPGQLQFFKFIKASLNMITLRITQFKTFVMSIDDKSVLGQLFISSVIQCCFWSGIDLASLVRWGGRQAWARSVNEVSQLKDTIWKI
jgi:hypothetical protein